MAARGTQSLAAQIQAFKKKVEARGSAFLRAYSDLVVSELVSLSPVGDPSTWKNPPPPGYVGGHFRGNWQASVGSPETRTTDRIDSDGGATIRAAAASVAGVALGDKIYITNNLPYARRLEYGWSQQAPAGMVRITMAQSRELARRALAEAQRVVP